MNIFVIGGNGTLGAQIAMTCRKLNLDVTTLIRRYTKETDLLAYRGVRLFYGDMNNKSILLEAMFGSNVVIDASQARIFDSIEDVEYKTKLILIDICKELKMDRFIFYSFVNAEKFTSLPWIRAKLCIEEKLKKSGLEYTIFRMAGFHPGVVKEYAAPLILKQDIYVTKANYYIPISYIHSIDVARLTIRSLSSNKMVNKTINLGSLETWNIEQILKTCTVICGKERQPRLKFVPLYGLQFFRFLSSLFEWAWPFTRKISLLDLLKSDSLDLVINGEEMIDLFEITPDELCSLDQYLSGYFRYFFINVMEIYKGNLEEDDDELEKWREKGVPIIDDEMDPEEKVIFNKFLDPARKNKLFLKEKEKSNSNFITNSESESTNSNQDILSNNKNK